MNKRAGQVALEYAVLIVVVIAALVSMQRYVKAHLMGRWRSVGDSFGGGQQYEPCDGSGRPCTTVSRN